MSQLKHLLCITLLAGVIAACSSRSSTNTQFADSNQTSDGSTSNIPPFQTPVPTSSPLPTPSPTPVANGWQSSTPTSQSYSGVQQTNSWSSFTGWPFNSGYGQGNNYNYNGYANGYQSQYDNLFPNYHTNYNNGYYIATLTALYRGVLGRNPDQPGVEFWMRELIAGRPFTNVREAFIASPEITALGNVQNVQNIIGLFRVIYGVLPERNALQFWLGQMAAGQSLSQVASSLRSNPQYGLGGNYSGLYTRSVVDLYKQVLGRFANFEELSRDVNGVASGGPILGILSQLRASSEAASIGKLNAENCSAVHRIIRGVLPERNELMRCVGMGDTTTLVSGTQYNQVLQRYMQSLMYQPLPPCAYIYCPSR